MSLRDIFCFKHAREHAARKTSRLQPEPCVRTARCAYCDVAIATGTDTHFARDMQFCCKTHRLMRLRQTQVPEVTVGLRRRASRPTLSDCADHSAVD